MSHTSVVLSAPRSQVLQSYTDCLVLKRLAIVLWYSQLYTLRSKVCLLSNLYTSIALQVSDYLTGVFRDEYTCLRVSFMSSSFIIINVSLFRMPVSKGIQAIGGMLQITV